MFHPPTRRQRKPQPATKCPPICEIAWTGCRKNIEQTAARIPQLLHADPTKDKAAVKSLTVRMATVIATGIAAVTIDRVFQLSELLVRR